MGGCYGMCVIVMILLICCDSCGVGCVVVGVYVEWVC